jgi:PiT family inorganic phosphate transporter
MLATTIFLIVLALFFDFLNGFHDSANSIATVVSTRVLSPRQAVVWAAFFNFIAFLFFGLHVANTIGKGIVDPSVMDLNIIFAALVGACIWNIITWYFGLPSSSSHALIGGMIGGAIVKSGTSGLMFHGISLTVVFIFVAPIAGMILGSAIATFVYWICSRFTPRQVDGVFRKGQYFSAALYSLGHGGNDAQKTMGIIWVLLITVQTSHPGLLPNWMVSSGSLPDWVVISCQSAMALGTLFGGWRIVKTMGQKVTKLKPVDGFCAESGASISLYVATMLGVPVSTTHTITGTIMGVGYIKRASAVKWGVAGRIVWAWILTIPCSAGIAAVSYILFNRFHG